MRLRLTILAGLILSMCVLSSCSGGGSQAGAQGGGNSTATSGDDPQWNVSIFLDLSARIDPSLYPSTPSHQEKDLAIISEVIKAFKADMERRQAYRAQGRIKVFFDPAPASPNINQLASSLEVDLKELSNQEKKEVYENIDSTFVTGLRQIYEESIRTKRWVGADVWGFFKRKVDKHCILEGYRNILIIITDGYIYHENSKSQAEGKYSYLLGPLFEKEGLRKASDWQQLIESKGFGLIAPRKDLKDLEVLILEITPEPNHPEDQDILEYTLGAWLQEMGVKKFTVEGTDLPSNTRRHITTFLK